MATAVESWLNATVAGVKPVYMRYRWSNYEKYAPDDASAILDKIGRTKDEMLQNSVTSAAEAAMQRVLKTMQNKDSSLTMEDLAVLENGFDGISDAVGSKTMERARKNAAAAMGSDTLESGELLQSFQDFASGVSMENKLKEAVHQKAAFNELLQKLIDSFSGSKNMKYLMEQYILTHYDQAKRELGNSALCSQIIASIRANGTGSLYKNSYADISALKAPVRRFLVQLYALSSGRVQIDASSKEALANSLTRFYISNFNDIQGTLGELSFAKAKMEANELLYKAVNKTSSTIASSTTKGVVQRDDGMVNVSMSFKGDTSLEAQLKKIQQQLGVQKSGFTFQEGNVVCYGKAQQKTDSVTVDSYGLVDGGISSKTSRSAKETSTGLKIGKLHLSDKTSLHTMLTKNLGWSGIDIERLMQLGIAEDDGSADLYAMWNGFKKYATAQAVFSALNGMVGNEDDISSTLLQINDAIVPMPTVILQIEKALSNEVDSGSAPLFNSVSKMGIPERGDFVGDNKSSWTGPDAESMQYAVVRSKKVYTAALMRLYNAKIEVRLNSFNLSVFSDLSF